jgi:putative Mn2+ efflux pump MntP
MHPFTLIVALGLDSFLACTVIGTRALSRRQRFLIASLFGACDAIATLFGSLWTHRPFELPAIALAALFLCACFLLPGPSTRFYGVPLLFSIDNLLAGSPATAAPVLGLSSALMALVGLCVGALSRRAFLRFAAQPSRSTSFTPPLRS